MTMIEIIKGVFKVRFSLGDPLTESAEGEKLELTDEELEHWYTRAALEEGRARVVAVEEAEEPEASPEDRIMAVFPKLADDDFKTDGIPKVKAVETLLGENVSADQVAEAWARHREGGN